MKFNKYQAIKQDGTITYFLETSKKEALVKADRENLSNVIMVKKGNEIAAKPIWKGKYWNEK